MVGYYFSEKTKTEYPPFQSTKMENKNNDVKIIRTIPIGENKKDFELFIIEKQEALNRNQYITLPLKKVPKWIDKNGTMIKVLETEVNIKGDIRIIELNI